MRGGVIATREDKNRQIIPEAPIYRVQLVVEDGASAPARTMPGTAQLQGEAVSIAGPIWRRTVAVLLRESGF